MKKARKGKVEQFTPPEGVPLYFTISTLGARLGAVMLDVFITTLAVFLVMFIISLFGFISIQAFLVLFIFCFYFTRVPYYLLCELIWNGQTLGKRIVGIRVINMSGRRLTPYQITARNLMKEVEFLTPLTLCFFLAELDTFDQVVFWIWAIVVFLVIVKNKKNQRMGDMIAGTLVVDNPRITLLSDMAISAPASQKKQELFDFKPEQLEFYGRFELQALEEVLRNSEQLKRIDDIRKIVIAIKNKIGFNESIKVGDEIAFLSAFYRAQREHLEKLQLFGKRRENKFYKHNNQNETKS